MTHAWIREHMNNQFHDAVLDRALRKAQKDAEQCIMTAGIKGFCFGLIIGMLIMLVVISLA